MRVVCECGANMEFVKCSVSEMGIATIRFLNMHKHWPNYITFICDCSEERKSETGGGVQMAFQRGMDDAKWLAQHLNHKREKIILN